MVIILLFLLYIYLNFSVIKTLKNNTFSNSISSLLWMIVPALIMKCALLILTCVGVAMQEAYCKKSDII